MGLYFDVPEEFLVQFIEIIAYSFENNQESFDWFIGTMKTMFVKHFRKLKYYCFKKALAFVSEQLYSKDLRWLGNLRSVGEFFLTIINDIIIAKEHFVTDEVLYACLSKDSIKMNQISNQRMVKIVK